VRLAVTLGYWSTASSSRVGADVAAGAAESLALTRAAEDLGYACAWASEAYGSDAPTVLAWLAAQTTRIGLGAAVMQIPARSAASTAMTAATLDALSGGRFRLGLGVSGPQVSEGWHGVRFAAPLARTREYVDVVRLVLSRRPVQYEGTHLRLPLPDGPGVALRLSTAPPRADLPVYLAAVGPRNVELAGEVADGWLPVFFSPEHAGDSLAALARGRARSTAPGPAAALDVVPTVPLLVTERVPDPTDAALAPLRAHAALYVGGMGSREANFYNALAVRMGYEAEAAAVQDHFLAGRHREAAAAVPLGFLEATCLVGPPEVLRDRLATYAEVGVTTLSVAPLAATTEQRIAALRTTADALEASGAAG
jgi:F420-dependent oxidoreductase-like protein